MTGSGSCGWQGNLQIRGEAQKSACDDGLELETSV